MSNCFVVPFQIGVSNLLKSRVARRNVFFFYLEITYRVHYISVSVVPLLDHAFKQKSIFVSPTWLSGVTPVPNCLSHCLSTITACMSSIDVQHRTVILPGFISMFLLVFCLKAKFLKFCLIELSVIFAKVFFIYNEGILSNEIFYQMNYVPAIFCQCFVL